MDPIIPACIVVWKKYPICQPVNVKVWNIYQIQSDQVTSSRRTVFDSQPYHNENCYNLIQIYTWAANLVFYICLKVYNVDDRQPKTTIRQSSRKKGPLSAISTWKRFQSYSKFILEPYLIASCLILSISCSKQIPPSWKLKMFWLLVSCISSSVWDYNMTGQRKTVRISRKHFKISWSPLCSIYSIYYLQYDQENDRKWPEFSTQFNFSTQLTAFQAKQKQAIFFSKFSFRFRLFSQSDNSIVVRIQPKRIRTKNARQNATAFEFPPILNVVHPKKPF